MNTQKTAFYCRLFSHLPGIKHAFLTRNFPGSKQSYTSVENRIRAIGALEFPVQNLSILKQTHSNKCVVIRSQEDVHAKNEADAQITKVPGIALGILTADCVPVLLADETQRIIGAAHAGWKGALAGILENTLSEMILLGAHPSRISAVIGPCIHQESYEVGRDLFESFITQGVTHGINQASQNKKFFKSLGSQNKYLFDLPGYVMQKLKNYKLKQVTQIEQNTFTNEDNFFSYRRSKSRNEETDGRLLSVIVIESH